MKKIFLLIIGLLFIFIIINIQSCSESNLDKTLAITVMKDMTDDFLLKVENDKIINLFDLDENSLEKLETGIKFRFMPLNNVDYNNTFDISIAYANYEEVNRLVRSKEIATFKSSIQKTLDQNEIFEKSLTSSSVFIPLMNELVRLSKIKATEKLVIIYSDMAENSNTTFRSYKEYKKGKEYIKQQFLKLRDITDISGINIIIRYQPKNETQNEQFRVMYDAYKEYLESKGAQVNFEFY